MIVKCRHYIKMNDTNESTAVLSIQRMYNEFKSGASESSSLVSRLNFEGKFIHSFCQCFIFTVGCSAEVIVLFLSIC